MSDIAIIRMISKIHVIIVTFLSIIGLTFLLLFLTLQEGVAVERLLLPGFKIQQLYIKWDEKLLLTANEIVITKSNTNESEPFDPAVIKDALANVKWFENWIGTVHIGQMQVDEYNATFY